MITFHEFELDGKSYAIYGRFMDKLEYQIYCTEKGKYGHFIGQFNNLNVTQIEESMRKEWQLFIK
jgi:hypothetical protein